MIYAPQDETPEGLLSHARDVRDAIGPIVASRTQLLMLASEIRNAIAPVAMLSELGPEEVTPEDLADVKLSVDRILALMVVLAGPPY